MEASVDTSRMKREIHEMPQYVAKAIKDRGVIKAYNSRPAYQQNDYVWWILHAKREADPPAAPRPDAGRA